MNKPGVNVNAPNNVKPGLLSPKKEGESNNEHNESRGNVTRGASQPEQGSATVNVEQDNDRRYGHDRKFRRGQNWRGGRGGHGNEGRGGGGHGGNARHFGQGMQGESKTEFEQQFNAEDDAGDVPKSEKKFTGRCRLFVGNLPSELTEEDFRKMFEPYGETTEIFLNASRGFGFIRMDTRQNAENARAALDGLQKKGRFLRCRFASHSAALRVKHLPPHVSNELLEQAFSMFGEVERAIVIVDDRGRTTGEGIVEFARKPGASAAFKRISEHVFLMTASPRPIIVEPLEQKDENDGMPEKFFPKSAEMMQERELAPRFAQVGSFEYECGLKWKELFTAQAEREEQLKRDFEDEVAKMEMDMAAAQMQQHTAMLRQDLQRRQEELQRLEEQQQMEIQRLMDMRRQDEERRRADVEMRRRQEEIRRAYNDDDRRQNLFSAQQERPQMRGNMERGGMERGGMERGGMERSGERGNDRGNDRGGDRSQERGGERAGAPPMQPPPVPPVGLGMGNRPRHPGPNAMEFGNQGMLGGTSQGILGAIPGGTGSNVASLGSGAKPALIMEGGEAKSQIPSLMQRPRFDPPGASGGFGTQSAQQQGGGFEIPRLPGNGIGRGQGMLGMSPNDMIRGQSGPAGVGNGQSRPPTLGDMADRLMGLAQHDFFDPKRQRRF